MGSRLQDKVILITGASRGVGEACAVACAREGAHLILASKTIDPHPKLAGTLGEVAEQVQALGREALVLALDVRSAENVDDVVARAGAHFGRIDAVVNNAGAIHWAPVADWSAKKFDLVMGVNARGAFLVARAAMPWLRKQGGHVLMMSPPINPLASPGKAPYLLSKIGMTMLAMAIDEEEENVSACALWPVSGIRTAATVNFEMGDEREWRTPDILADATVELLARDPMTARYRAWLDEEVLAEAGVTNLDHYRCDPNTEPTNMSIELVWPGWTR
jgi:citronellol/citronellal dehydrogenase